MFKALLKTRFANIFSTMFRTKGSGTKKKSVPKTVLMTILFIYVLFAVGAMFGSMFYTISEPFHQAGIDWLYFSLAIALSIIFCFIGSVFFTKSEIYNSKDNDLLLSMPIPPRMILMSRLVSLIIISYAYEFLVFIPATAVYAYKIGFSLGQFLFLLLVILVLPFISITMSLIFSGIIAYFESKMRRKNIFSLVLSLSLFAIYMYFYMSINKYISALLLNGVEFANAIKRAVYILYCGGFAISNTSVIHFVFFACFAVIPFVLACMVLSVTFMKIAAAKKGSNKIVYKEERVKKSTTMFALLRRETSRFWSLPMYVLNSSIGAIFLIILAFLIPTKLSGVISALVAEIPGSQTYMGIIICAAISFIVIMNLVSAPSISLEGKTFWILRSLPVKAKDILISKVYFHICIVSIPTLIASVSACIFIQTTALDKAMIILVPQAVNILNAFLGVIINLQLPKFDWVNETVAVKQSVSVLLTMASGMGIIGSFAILYSLLLNKFLKPDLFMLVIFVILIILIVFLRKYLLGKGAVKFELI